MKETLPVRSDSLITNFWFSIVIYLIYCIMIVENLYIIDKKISFKILKYFIESIYI